MTLTGSFSGTELTQLTSTSPQTNWGTRRTRIREILEEDDPVIWTQDTLMSYANEALVDISARLDHEPTKYTFNTATGIQTYSRPSNDLEVIAVFRDNVALTRESIQDWKDLSDYLLNATGVPTHYRLDSSSIYLRPIPSDTFSIDYYSVRRAAFITSATTTVDIDPVFYRAFDEYVLARAYEQTHEWDPQKAHWENYMRFLSDALDQINDETMGDAVYVPEEVW